MLLTTLLLAMAPQVQAAELLPVCVSGRWGYVDRDGTEVIPFRYHLARPFHMDLAAVLVEGSWHYIDPTGAQAFVGTFARAHDFIEGRAAVALDSDQVRWGFLDREGAWVGGEAQWTEVGDYSEGMAAVFDGKAGGYLNLAGELVIREALILGLPSSFHQGLAAYDFVQFGLSATNSSYARAIRTDGKEVFRVDGKLVRIPGAFAHQEVGRDDHYRILEDDGRPRRDEWFTAVAMPREVGPLAVQLERPGREKERDDHGDGDGGSVGDGGNDWEDGAEPGRWAYLKTDGSLTQPAELSEAFAFHGGLAAARRQGSGRYGYLDTQGNWVIDADFSYAGDFEGEVALVKIRDDICWIGRDGRQLWNPRRYPVQTWELELAAEKVGNSVGQIDRFIADPQQIELGEVAGVYRDRFEALARARAHKGAEVVVDSGVDSESHFVYAVEIPVLYDRISAANRDFTLVEADVLAEYYFEGEPDLGTALSIVNTGRIRDDVRLLRILNRDMPSLAGRLRVDAPSYYQCTQFGDPLKLELHGIGPHEEIPSTAEELLPQPMTDEEVGVTFWDPQTFDTAFEGVFQDARPFSEGLASVRKDGLYGFIDLRGKWVVPPRYTNTAAFHGGWCVVLDPGTGLLGYIDRDGKSMLPARYAAVGDFHQDRAIIQSDGLWGYIDRSGETVIAAAYDWAGDFASGLAPVRKDGLVGYVDLAGEVVVPLQYTMGSTHVEGMATVVDGDNVLHYLDAQGRSVISGEFSFGSDFLDGVALVQESESQAWRLIDSVGDLRAPVETVE